MKKKKENKPIAEFDQLLTEIRNHFDKDNIPACIDHCILLTHNLLGIYKFKCEHGVEIDLSDEIAALVVLRNSLAFKGIVLDFGEEEMEEEEL